MCSELCIRAVFDRSVRQTVADKCYFPMYYSHVHSDVLRYIAMYYSHSHSYTPLYYSHDNAVQRNALSFVHLHSVELITARQTVADPFFAACMARSVWPCLYGAHTFLCFANTLSGVLHTRAFPHLLLAHCSNLQSSHLKPFTLEHFQAPRAPVRPVAKF